MLINILLSLFFTINKINIMEINLDSLEFDMYSNSYESIESVTVDSIELHDGEIKNPFYISNTECPLKELEKKELYSNYKKVYILCTRNDIVIDKLTSDDKDILAMFFDKIVDLEEFNKLSKYFTIIEASSKILKNKEHFAQAIIVDTMKSEGKNNILEIFNHNKYSFENFNEIIIPMIELTENFANIYKDQYEMPDENNNIFKAIMLDVYYNRDNYHPNIYKLHKSITSIKESDYWSIQSNCNYTITKNFIDRKFKYTFKESHVKGLVKANSIKKNYDIEINKVINELEKDVPKNNNYLEHIYRKDIFVDIHNGLKDLKNRTYYATADEKLATMKINYELVNELFHNLDSNLHKKYLYDIFNILLVSKEYCHLVLNNKFVLEKMKNIIDENYHIYRYLFGYAWLCFYTEECIFKTKTTDNKRYVFDINTANLLPVFPLVQSDIHLNPYITLLTSQKSIDIQNNCMTLPMSYNNFEEQYGVCDLTEFKKRFNLFTTGNETKNIFDSINWNNFAVSGSVIPACLMKKSPLIDLVKHAEQNDNDNMKTYFGHYYSNSDIDLMCNTSSVFDFMDKFELIIRQINKNIYKTDEFKLTIEPKKTLALIIHCDYIKLKLDEINQKLNTNYDLNNIIENIAQQNIKEYFYDIYTNYKNIRNEAQKLKFTKDNILYNHFYNLVSIDEMNIYIVDNFTQTDFTENSDNEYYQCVNDFKSPEDKVSYELNKILFKISESIKFKIHSKKMLHSIEAFQVKGDSFYSVITKFHLPCVRAYYNGETVKILPSCLTAMMTGINIDYKYFAGIRDPIDIINKYRMRGFGILLNDTEKQHMLYYNSKLNNTLNNIFNVNIRSKNSISKFFGFQNINSDFFKPLVYLMQLPRDIYNTIPTERTFANINDMDDYIKDKKKYDVSTSIINTSKLKTIDENGMIIPLKKWLLDI